jgi:MFS family permease
VSDTRNAHHLRNLLAFGFDYTFFRFAITLINSNAVVPSLAAQLTHSPVLIGLTTTVWFVAWSAPQLLAGNVVSRLERKKPFLMRLVLLGRPVVLLYGLALLLTGGQPPWLLFVALCLALVTFSGMDSYAAVAWLELLGLTLPAERRGRYIAIWQVLAGLLSLGAAYIVRQVLGEGGPGFPANYAWLFMGAGGVLMLAASVGLASIYERPADDCEVTPTIAWRDFSLHLARIWRAEPAFRRVVLTQVMLRLGGLAAPLYILYATDELGLPLGTAGQYVALQMIGGLVGGLLMGQLSDRKGAQRVIQAATAVVMTAPALALALTLTDGADWLVGLYGWVYVCLGVIDNMILLGYMNYVLDLAPPGQRPIYMGTSNAIGGMATIAPIFGGWLLLRTSYGALFGAALALHLAALVLALQLPDARRRLARVGSDSSEVGSRVAGGAEGLTDVLTLADDKGRD